MFLNAMYGGLGQSLGALIGGKLQSKLGTVTTFLYAGTFDLCFVMAVIAYLRIRKSSSFRNPKPLVPPPKDDDHVATVTQEDNKTRTTTQK